MKMTPRAAFRRWRSLGASATGLAIILRQSYLAVADDWHGLNKSARPKTHRACLSLGGPYKNGYSPQMRQLQVYMAFSCV
jgi:hypothetical protein